MKWFTALLFSIAVHILIFLSYVFFATESEVSTSRKITNVNFFDEELQEKGEMIKSSAPQKREQKMNGENLFSR